MVLTTGDGVDEKSLQDARDAGLRVMELPVAGPVEVTVH